MNHNNSLNKDEIEVQQGETKKSIIINSLAAIVIAISIFFSVIYPIEFGKDPLGTGALFGLPKLTSEASVIRQVDSDTIYQFRKDSVEILVPANRGIEYKFKLDQYSNLTYHWSSEEILYFDFHGEPKGDTSGYFESYTIANSNSMEGSLTTPFDGNHGWYWKNNSDNEVLVTLNTQGNYEVLGYVH